MDPLGIPALIESTYGQVGNKIGGWNVIDEQNITVT